ncbi:DUF1127 domain-containing protein [Rhizobium sp. P38BS-XIX]|nr:DUF1127 domain-containing protein [Rhizobium sp. P38BS-XIX]
MTMLNVLRLWQARHSERRSFARELMSLPDASLKDFGITRHSAYELSHRPFWRA